MRYGYDGRHSPINKSAFSPKKCYNILSGNVWYMTKKRTIIILCVALCFGAAGYLLSRRPVRPNVILIMSETLRTDHLGCYGYDRDTTPNIDAFAGGAALFTNAYTQAPCTDPAIFNVMTSRYYASIPLDDDYFTLAEYFREKEYRTAAFIANSAANPNTSHLYQGFESYDFGSRRRRGGSVTGAAMRWIEHVGKKRFFTWLFYFDPHRPHVAPKDFRGYYAQSEKLSGDEQEIARYMKSLSLQGKKISP
jgi:arylsulfatase A-like enzyme